MIEYLPPPQYSQYFEANKRFCERIIAELNQLKIDYSGFCTSYGYDIYISTYSNGVLYKINFHRHQSTGAPVGLSADTRTRHYTQLEIININSHRKIQINGLTTLKSLFWGTKKLRLKNGYDYTAKPTLSLNQNIYLIEFLNNLKVFRLSLSKGKLKTSFKNDRLLPSEVVTAFNELLKNWA